MKRTTIRLPDELLRKAKIKASAEGRTLTSLVAEGLRLVMSRRHSASTQRVELPVSKQRGGTHEGVDINNSEAILDLLDDK